MIHPSLSEKAEIAHLALTGQTMHCWTLSTHLTNIGCEIDPIITFMGNKSGSGDKIFSFVVFKYNQNNTSKIFDFLSKIPNKICHNFLLILRSRSATRSPSSRLFSSTVASRAKQINHSLVESNSRKYANSTR